MVTLITMSFGKRVITVFAWLTMTTALAAEDNLRLDPFSLGLKVHSQYFDLDIEPRATLGFPVQSFGVQVQAKIRPPNIVILNLFYLYAQLGHDYSFSNLGIPGSSQIVFGSTALGISVGARGTLPNHLFPVGDRRHSLIFQYNNYWDTRDTDSATGSIGYYYSQRHFLVGFMFENDSLAFQQTDEYRTFGTEASSLFQVGDNHTIGGGFGLKMWTGAHPLNNTTVLDRRGQAFDISANHGGTYPHAIVYGSFYFNTLKFSIGWDSEKVRDLFQNGFHFLVNQAALSLVDRPDRFFIQLEFNPHFAIY